MNENNTSAVNQKVASFGLLDKLAQDFKAKLDATNNQVESLVTAGGEPNVITAIKVNGAAATITGKAVDITVPTAVSDLTNDAGYQTSAQVNNTVKTAIAKTGHAHFEVADAVPAAANAADNVLYLVMNSETSHYDIYARVIGDPDFGNFAGTYGIDFEGGTTKEVFFRFPSEGFRYSFNVDAGTKMEGLADSLNSMIGNHNLAARFDTRSGQLVITDKDTGETPDVWVGLSQTVTAETALTPKTFTAQVVLLDDTTVDLSGYDTAEQSNTKLAGKVDKEEGKGLSTNDYTTAEKQKLAGIEFATETDYNAMIARVFGTAEDAE